MGKILILNTKRYKLLKLLKSLMKREGMIGNNCSLKEWFEIRNKIREIKGKLNE